MLKYTLEQQLLLISPSLHERANRTNAWELAVGHCKGNEMMQHHAHTRWNMAGSRFGHPEYMVLYWMGFQIPP